MGWDVLSDHFQLSSVTNSLPLGSAQSSGVPGSSLGGSITGTVYSFPPNLFEGEYLMFYHVVGNSTALTRPVVTPTNCVFLFEQANDSATSVDNSGSTYTIYMLNICIQVTNANATLAFGTSGTLPASFSAGDLWLTQLNPNIVT